MAENYASSDSESNDGWPEFTYYAKKHKKKEANGAFNDDYDEDETEEVNHHYNDYDEDEREEVKKVKPKKPKVTLVEAAAQIDASDLEAFLGDISAAFKEKDDIQMKRFSDYFERAFSPVSASQFPWVRVLKEVPVRRTVYAPLCHISDAVYKTSVNWINHRSSEGLSSFMLWCLDSILSDLRIQLNGSKKAVQQIAKFIGLAMVLRRKPDTLISVLPTLRENKKYQGLDKLPLITWMVVQASVGDLSVGLYAWSQNLLPIVVGKKSGNMESRDFVLQVVEKILSTPNARPVLIGAVRKGKQLIPPRAFETLICVTFPSSNRVKGTEERFAVIYPVLREVVLCGSPGSKAMQQIFSFAIKAAGENKNPELSKEAVDIVIWCFSRSTKCYKQWKNVYEYNIVASVAVLKKLSDDWNVQATKLSSYEPLREILKHFRQKNKKALDAAPHHAHFKDADKYCKIIAGRVSQGLGCKAACLTFAVLASAVVVLYPNFGISGF
ncbi:hypothetical protein TSUD_68610 [Trifolium subterraneum]|uniref:Uncharacterized protein n=1 Tax=Trifolium subterraneum TaxID=3900 RepID=A0A2Z6N7L4_TRISU|nr:hypothetical protein TSUD_68610 [Trifolium subterraneum]